MIYEARNYNKKPCSKKNREAQKVSYERKKNDYHKMVKLKFGEILFMSMTTITFFRFIKDQFHITF
jgi:hypothetical protein